MAQWKTLTREDLRAFDTSQTEAVLYAMRCGGVARLSNNGHVIIRNSNGQTMSVSRSSGGRRKQNVARDLVRLFGAPVEEETRNRNGSSTAPTLTVAPEPEPETTETLECPAARCTETFVTEGARYQHVAALHYRCSEGCGAVFDTAQGASMHRRRAHEGFDPNAGRKPAKATPEPAEATPEPAEAKPEPEPEPVEAKPETTTAVEALAPTPLELEVGRTVARLRTERHWTQGQLADELRDRGWAVHRRTLSCIETGTRYVRLAEMMLLAEVLGEGVLTTLRAGLPTQPEETTATDTLRRIRELLGEDTRVNELEQALERRTRERDDAMAHVALVREALGITEPAAS